MKMNKILSFPVNCVTFTMTSLLDSLQQRFFFMDLLKCSHKNAINCILIFEENHNLKSQK